MHLDEVISELGGFSRHQLLQLLLALWASIITAWSIFVFVFTGGAPKHRCLIEGIDNSSYTESNQSVLSMWIPVDETTGSLDTCHVYKDPQYGDDNLLVPINSSEKSHAIIPCNMGWVYDKSQYASSTVSDWDLVCDRKYMISVTHSLFMLGFLVGSFTVGPLADRLGRKVTACGMLTGEALFNILQAFMPEIYSFMLIRFICGICCIGSYLTLFILVNEMCSTKLRMVVGMAVHICYAFGIMLLAVFAYYIRSWSYLQLAISIPMLAVLSYWWLLDESLRWLIAHGHVQRAQRVASKIADRNRKAVLDDSVLEKMCLEITNETSQPKTKANMLDLLRTPNMRKNALTLFFLWFVNSAVYYGLSLNTHSLAGNPYFNFFLIGLVEVPAKIYCIFSLQYMGRRPAQYISFAVAGAACIACAFLVEELEALQVAIFMLGKCGVAASFTISYQYSAEIFPTVLRNTGTGCSSTSARIGGLLAPYIIYLNYYLPTSANTILGSLGLLAAIATLLLPETRGKHLPESLEDGEQFGKDHTVFALCKRDKDDADLQVYEFTSKTGNGSRLSAAESEETGRLTHAPI